MAYYPTKVSDIPPTFLRDFSRQRRRILCLWTIWKRNFFFFSVICLYSRRKLTKIADYFELAVPRYHCNGFKRHFRKRSKTFELLTNLLAPSVHIHLVGRPLNKEKRQLWLIWALENQYTCRQIPDRTLLSFRAGQRELSSSTSWAGPVWPEPVLSVVRTRAFHLRTVQSGRPVLTNGKRL